MIRPLILSLVLLTGTALAQFVTITGTVLDPSGAPYQQGSGRVVLVSGNGSGQQNWTLGGTNPVQTPRVINNLDSFGKFSIQLANTSIIDQQAAQPEWQFCFAANQAIQPQVSFCLTPLALASNQDISGAIQSQSALLPGSSSGGSPILVVANFNGSDWCAKLKTADQTLGTTRGTLLLSPGAGTAGCLAAAPLSSNHTLEIAGGAFTTSCSGITVNSVSNVSILGMGGASISLPNGCPNFSRPLNIIGSTNVTVNGIEVNGNGDNQQVGEQDHNIIAYDSSHVKILNVYSHDAQGDGVLVGTDSSMTSGCEDILVWGSTFDNIGRSQFTLVGYGCNDVRIVDNHFDYGTVVTTSTSHGNAIHIEGDNAGTGFNKITVSNNTITGAVGSCISMTAHDTNPILGVVVTGNQCTGTNSSANLSAPIVLLLVQDAEIGDNTALFTGATAGTDGILLQEAPGQAAQLHKISIHDNTIKGVSSACYHLTSSVNTVGQAIDLHDNIGDGCGTYGIQVNNLFSQVEFHDNTLLNIQGSAVHLEAIQQFNFHDNTIRDFGLGGVDLNGLEILCNGVNTAVGPGKVHDNYIGNGTTSGKTGISEQCPLGATGIEVYNNTLNDNAVALAASPGSGYTNTTPPGSLPANYPGTASGLTGPFIVQPGAGTATNGFAAVLSNKFPYSEPLLANWSNVTGGVSQASFSENGLSNGFAFTGAAQLDNAYDSCNVSATTTYTISAFVVMGDSSVPNVGASAGLGDFSLVVAANLAPTNITVQLISGALYRVSGSFTTIGSASSSCGIVRYSTQSGKAFRASGLQWEQATSAGIYTKTTGSPTSTANVLQTVNLTATGQMTSSLASGTPPLVVASTTPVADLTTVPTTYNHSGTQETNVHIVQDSCVLGTSCSITLTGAAVFTSSTSYTCACQDNTAIDACNVVQSSGSAFAITGTGTDTIRYICTGN